MSDYSFEERAWDAARSIRNEDIRAAALGQRRPLSEEGPRGLGGAGVGAPPSSESGVPLAERIDAGLGAIEERYRDYIHKAGDAQRDGNPQLATEYLWRAHGLAEASAEIRLWRVPAKLRSFLPPMGERRPLTLLTGGVSTLTPPQRCDAVHPDRGYPCNLVQDHDDAHRFGSPGRGGVVTWRGSS